MPSNENPTPSLLRQQTWDKESKSSENEPRSLPPQFSPKSPILVSTDLCKSLGRISLQSDDDILTLTECLERAQFYIEKAKNLENNKNEQISRNVSTPNTSIMNKSDNSNIVVKLTVRSKASSRVLLTTRSTLSSTAKSVASGDNVLSPNIRQKSEIRRSISGIGIHANNTSGTIGRILKSPRVSPTVRTSLSALTKPPTRR